MLVPVLNLVDVILYMYGPVIINLVLESTAVLVLVLQSTISTSTCTAVLRTFK